MRFLLPLLLLVASMAPVAASEGYQYIKYVLAIDKELSDPWEDWGPGEGGSVPDAPLPNCNDVGEDFLGECIQTEPAVAPDNCHYYDWTYEADIYLVYGCG